jgi:hypothetical protein
MNALTPHIQDDEERHRIAARAPVDVYVPNPDPEQYVSDYSGNYWPYRAMTYRDAKANQQAAERTVNRTLEFQLTDTRNPGHNFPADLFALADNLNADVALPAIYTGSGRSALRAPVEAYQSHDFTNRPQFVLPAPDPHGLTLSCIRDLTENTGTTPGLLETPYPTNIALRNLRAIHTTAEGLIRTLETAQTATSGDVNIQLYNPPLSTALIDYIATTPNAVDSIILPETVDTLVASQQSNAGADDTSLLSATGHTNLSDTTSPHVRVAAEISLLTSSFLDDDTRPAALAESVLPNEPTTSRQTTRPTNPQQTLSRTLN